MNTRQRFRFAIQLTSASSAAELLRIARRVEELGYSTLFVQDHAGDKLGPIVTLMAVAGATKNLRIGSHVFNNDFRHPAILAKEAATLDTFSGGRLELGMGAGWQDVDYQSIGISKDSAAKRIDRLAESISVMKGLFSEGCFSFRGRYYSVAELEGLPKPHQQPHPPIIIGGGGRRILSLAGSQADIVSINLDLRRGTMKGGLSDDGSATAVARKIRWVSEAAGARFDDLELILFPLQTVITNNSRLTAEGLAARYGIDRERVLNSPYFLVGSQEGITEALSEIREVFGISYIVVRQSSLELLSPLVEQLSGR